MSYIGESIGIIKNAPGCGACGPAVQAKSKCSDIGPEWQYSGYGSCDACKFNCVNFGVGTACTAGTHARCKKIQHLGDKTSCCLGNMPTGYPRNTCSPDLSPLSDTCSDIVKNYCSSGDRIFSDDICKSWSANNTQQAFNIKKNYCNPSLINTDSNCRSWVASSEAQGKIDDLMVLNYCQQYSSDPLCKCVMSEITCPNKFDSECIKSGGYKTADMQNVTCPSVMNCNQYINLSPGAKAIATNVEQNCTTVTSGGNNTQPEVIAAKTSKFNSGIWSRKNIIILVIFIVLIIFGAIAAVIFMQEDDKNQNQNQNQNNIF